MHRAQKMIQEIEKKNQEKEAEKEPEEKGLCLGTLFVALVVGGGSVVYLKRPRRNLEHRTCH